MHKLTYISICVVGTIFTSCYQKKAERNPNWGKIHQEVEDESDSTDVVFYADTFKLVHPHLIARDIQKNLKRKWVLTPVKFNDIEGLDTLEIIHQMALSEVYSSSGAVVKNGALVKESNSKLEQLSLLFCEEENIVRTALVPTDSLPEQMKMFLKEATEQKYVVYADAKKWVETLYLSLQQINNIKNKKQFEDVINLQIANGREMLIRLYAYQEFEPLAQFSQQLITIFDEVKEKMDFNELLALVSDIRDSFGVVQQD